MDRRASGQHCCKHRKLLQTLRNRLCTAFSLRTVNAATLYQRVAPPDALDEVLEEKTPGEVLGEAVKSEKENEVLTSDGSVPNDGDVVFNTQDENKSGWLRIKQAYTVDHDSGFIPLELQELTFILLLSGGLGFIYGGLPASYLGRRRYIERSQGAAYETRFHAVSDSYSAGARGLIRYGIRWGWRVAFVATSFQFLSTCSSLYRNKVDIWNYGIAGCSTGAMYRINMGLKGMVGSGVAGLVVGIPSGILLLFAQKLTGISSLERSRRNRAHFYKQFEAKLDDTQQENTDAIEYLDKWLKEKEKQIEDKSKR